MEIRGLSTHVRGQGTTETILLLPFYLLLALGLLQLAQLGTALLIANYAASSIARQVVQNGSFNQGAAISRFKNVMTAGMKNPEVVHSSSGGLLSNVTIQACAEVSAFPFVAQFLQRPLSSYAGGCGAANTMGPFSLKGRHFIVHGRSTARMNYKP